MLFQVLVSLIPFTVLPIWAFQVLLLVRFWVLKLAVALAAAF
ncbi:Uncharacterised protein [Pantoea agglomerans]|nr:Uncharacterised protein [Pantoea agglomerans]